MTSSQPFLFHAAFYFAFGAGVSILIGIALSQILLGLAAVVEKKEAAVG